MVLECCEGAKGGVLGSAAELFVKSGADAVIAHLWPIKAGAAQRCSLALYSALTGAASTVGDVGASLAAARRSFLKGNAERFSPVLYLRGLDTVLLDFGNRSVVRPTRGTTIAPALDKLLKVPFSILVGDDGEDRQALRIQTEKYLIKAADSENDLRRLSLGALMQRVALRFGDVEPSSWALTDTAESILKGYLETTLAGLRENARPAQRLLEMQLITEGRQTPDAARSAAGGRAGREGHRSDGASLLPGPLSACCARRSP